MARLSDRPTSLPNRRDFLFKNACAALTATGIASSIHDLRLIRAAVGNDLRSAAKTVSGGRTVASGSASPPPYKALVCIFLFGGNDGNNLLVPTDTATYAQYLSARVAAASGGLAIPNVGKPGGLLPLNPVTSDGHTYGIHPSMPEIQALFNGGSAAFVANVGTLLAPLSRAQYLSNSVATPSQLFSHNDQQVEWQTSVEDQPPTTGWGGRSADLLYGMNSNNAVSMNISISGSNTLETGNTVQAYNIATSGAVSVATAGTAQYTALTTILGLSHSNLYESALTKQIDTALADYTLLNTALNVNPQPTFTTAFPSSSLGQQLKMIARLIAQRSTLGHSREIYFASSGGFDLHGAEGANTGAQAALLADVSASMNALYQATAQLGVSTGVTQYTMSDFGRTLPVNSINGADHGWGSHHLVVGGGVVGQKIYGTYPTLVVNGPDDTSTGRWIPTTSVDQYAATLASWFGVLPASMSTVFPYLGRFSTPNLGFLG